MFMVLSLPINDNRMPLHLFIHIFFHMRMLSLKILLSVSFGSFELKAYSVPCLEYGNPKNSPPCFPSSPEVYRHYAFCSLPFIDFLWLLCDLLFNRKREDLKEMRVFYLGIPIKSYFFLFMQQKLKFWNFKTWDCYFISVKTVVSKTHVSYIYTYLNTHTYMCVRMHTHV